MFSLSPKLAKEQWEDRKAIEYCRRVNSCLLLCHPVGYKAGLPVMVSVPLVQWPCKTREQNRGSQAMRKWQGLSTPTSTFS